MVGAMKTAPTPPREQPAIQVLERMFAILDVLAGHAEPMPLKLIAERTGLHT